MKRHFFFFIFSALVGSCSSKTYRSLVLNDKVYESKKGPLYNGNKFSFNSDGTFIYIGQGPSVFLSKGTWQYNPSNKEISFTSKPPDEKFINPITIDTLWVDISKKKAMLISKRKIVFENISYFQY